jgi:hypothetical protein
MSAKPTFTAVIRWRGPDPAVEIETQHPGFDSPEEAALFANGIPPASPIGLHLAADASAVLLLSDDREIPCPSENIAFLAIPSNRLDNTDLFVANDTDFEPLALAEVTARTSAHGDYVQAQYGVLDPNNAPLDVQVDWDETDRLRVTVAESSPSPTTEPTFCLGAFPEA